MQSCVETPRLIMDFSSGAHIRAPSLKRGKSDSGLNERVSLNLVEQIFLNMFGFVLFRFDFGISFGSMLLLNSIAAWI